MVITDGYVVAQANSGGPTSPIAQFPDLLEAANWLLSIYTREGDSAPLPQYDPSLYVVEEWSAGAPTGITWQAEANGSVTQL